MTTPNEPNLHITDQMIDLQYILFSISTSEGPLKGFLDSLKDEDFERTKIGHQYEESVNLEERSSWTYNKTINIYNTFIDDRNLEFKIIKYKEGDFFKLHKDSHGTHTILIFCPSEFKGGDLILKKNDLWEIKIKPSIPKDRFLFLKFSTDFLHEVTPVIEGERYVLKASINEEDEEEEIVNDDWGGGLDAAEDYGDY